MTTPQPAADGWSHSGAAGRGAGRADPPSDLPAGLGDALAAAQIPFVTDQAVLAGHCVDWTGRWHGPALASVRPRSTEEVALVLVAARAARVAVQVQGGNTGLVGGSVPDRPCLLLLTTGLDRLDPVDPGERTAVVGAGVTAARLEAHARTAGLHFGVDLASRDSATVGGMAATNAGGIGVCAYGMMRAQLRGLVAVLADGRVVRSVGRPRKDNCGYDLTGLLAGSEGTLGVITEVEVALHPRPAASTVGLLAVPDLAAAVELARRVQRGRSLLLAAEVVDAAAVARAADALGSADPLRRERPAQWLLLLEVADGGSAEGLADVADHVVAVATTPADRERLWAVREMQAELHSRYPGLRKLDVSVRLADLDAAVAAIRSAVAGGPAEPAGRVLSHEAGQVLGERVAESATEPSGHRGPGDVPEGLPEVMFGAGPDADAPQIAFFGHLLDGNLHVQLVGASEATERRAIEAVAAAGGSISAEHGIGRMKRDQLHLARSAEQIDWMRAIKSTVDPQGLLNPGVLIDPLRT